MKEAVFFSLGSNQGDRKANLEMALNLMDEALGSHYQRVSSFIETQSWGFEADPFLNCAVKYLLDDEPESVLDKCKGIERRMGRNDIPEYDASGKRVYHSRIIDIDILYYGDRIVDTEKLTVPHPLIEQRDFVKIPLNEII